MNDPQLLTNFEPCRVCGTPRSDPKLPGIFMSNLYGTSWSTYFSKKAVIPSLHMPLTMLTRVASSIVDAVFLRPGRFPESLDDRVKRMF
ncbi:MAG: hypothetical protein NPIRA06_23070 [Nitrospirales bacterium]|nr:MAG: hypothetical protein NPIRA06_23070 [Nitrospirales bacterium]